MSDPKPLGIGIPTGASAGMRQVHCPGALLRVTRQDYDALKSAGTLFASASKDIRTAGYSDARVFCRDDVAVIREPNMTEETARESGRKIVYSLYHKGLCDSCGRLETFNRQDLARRQGGA